VSDSLVLLTRDDAVATLTFNDPERHNAMTSAMGEAFAARVAELGADASVRAVVLTGAGRAFSAGGDLEMIARRAQAGADDPGGPTRQANFDGMRAFYELFLAVRGLPCPSVAAIHGYAIGAGLCVALACDLRIAARDATLSLNFAQLGIHPGMGATWTLPRVVGPAQAADLLMTGRRIDGTEAARIGLVSRCTEPDALQDEALAMARTLASNGPVALRGIRAALDQSLGTSLPEQLAFEAQQQALCYETRDLQEGIRASRERRKPQFKGT
jgi:enoyl-CoA hydratase